MTVLVLGSGAREHALVDRLLGDLAPPSVVCAPGNPGIAAQVPTYAVNLSDPEAMLALADAVAADVTIVGPEVPLSVGVADRFARAGRLLLGPTQAAARLETSKAFAKAFMQRHGVPTAAFRTCDTLDDARAVLRGGTFGWPVVLKADGLAAGKGVVIAQTLAEAESAAVAAMAEGRFGEAGRCLVIEECLTGPEVSFFVLCDGQRGVPLGSAQDHKRIFDGDAGPNTGGMGAFAPSPLMTAAVEAEVMHQIVQPVLRGMQAEGHPFRGFLYVGLMLTPAGPRVIEFNVRLGDPETQVVLPRLSGDIVPLFAAAAAGDLGHHRCAMRSEVLVGVVLASRGYPDGVEDGYPIHGIEGAVARGNRVLHAGTAQRDGRLVTAGGRVLTVVGRGVGFAEAIADAYAGVQAIHFDGMQYRTDIGAKALTER